MRKCKKWVWISVLLFALFWGKDLMRDKAYLGDHIIRLHVVANSDSSEDQAVKLQVRDAIIDCLSPVMESISDKEQAQIYIQENIAALEGCANQVLHRLGVTDTAKVTLQQEKFGIRHYETFSLPSGVYDSLRVEIGDGAGKNWWCVVFPSLCMPAAADEFQDTAAASGFDTHLASTLTGDEKYQIRFFLLDCLGKLENFFYRG